MHTNRKPSKLGLALIAALSLTVISACSKTEQASTEQNIAQHKDTLATVVASRDAEMKARDIYRNPTETLAFFKLEPGMAVAEALPGGGWYSNIIANYLGSEGQLHGINYVDDMWARFGFFSEDNIAQRIASTTQFPDTVSTYTDNGITTSGFTFDSVPDNLTGSLDRVLFIRALHNLNRFEAEANTMTNALAATHKLLKSDGMVGVVQHRAPQNSADDWADGSRGYLKQAELIATFKAAGFTLVSQSEINANAKDQPEESDIVWRLPPSYNGSQDDPEKKANMTAIGESDRMTLLFKKS